MVAVGITSIFAPIFWGTLPRYIYAVMLVHVYRYKCTCKKVEDKERNGKRNNNYLIKYCISGRFYTMVSKDQYNSYIYTYTLTIQKLLFSSIDNFFSQDWKVTYIYILCLKISHVHVCVLALVQTKLQFNSL